MKKKKKERINFIFISKSNFLNYISTPQLLFFNFKKKFPILKKNLNSIDFF